MSTTIQTLCDALTPLLTAPARVAAAGDTVAGVRPGVVVEPVNEEEVAAVLAFADREGLKVLTSGGGTQLGYGRPPTGGDLLLSTTRLGAVLEHEPQDQTIAVQSGVPLAELQQRLGRSRQWLALDPALPEGATIGGIVATNTSGARRLRFGGVRDQILGVRVVLADGTIAKGGGKVVKNVAGYDLPKLFCGALGTLGVVVAANFRLYPLPALSRTILLRAPSPAALCALVLAVNASTLVPTALDVIGPSADEDGCVLAVRFESSVRAAVEDQTAALLTLAGELAASRRLLEGDEESTFWRGLDEALWPRAADGHYAMLKASLLPTEVAGWLAQLDACAAARGLATRWRAHAGHGTVFARLVGAPDALAAAVDDLRLAAASGRGSVVVQDAPPETLRIVDVWGTVPALDVMRRLKDRFDPHGTLNPGRFVGGI